MLPNKIKCDLEQKRPAMMIVAALVFIGVFIIVVIIVAAFCYFLAGLSK